MTDQEIDNWVEEHIKVPPKEELNEHTTVVYPQLVPALIEWGKVIAHKFYRIGKSEIPINLTWKDIDIILHSFEEMKEEIINKHLDDQTICKTILKKYKKE